VIRLQQFMLGDDADPKVIELYQKLQKMKKNSPEYHEMMKKIRILSDLISNKNMKRRKDDK
jgi:hypothetical protein